jgi:hypothetical protein
MFLMELIILRITCLISGPGRDSMRITHAKQSLKGISTELGLVKADKGQSLN